LATSIDSSANVSALLAGWREEQTRFLAEMVKVPSDNPPGDCVPHALRAAELLEAMGYKVEQYPVPEDAVKAYGMQSAINLVIRETFGSGGPTIALNAHGDVVPPGLGWTVDPYGAQIKEGWMYGRGVAVSKSDFATYAYALRALKESGIALNGTVELHFTYDEEAGGVIGPEWLLANGISKPDFAVSAGFSYGVVTAHNGCLHLEVECIGKSAHAARPETGYDALHAATDVMSALYKLRRSYAKIKSKIPGIEHPTLTIGLIEGGINTNVVPDNVKFRIDRRIIPDEDPVAVEHDLVEFIRGAAETHPTIRVRTRRIVLARPFIPLPGHEKLVTAIQKSGKKVMGEEIAPHGVPLYTDARHYSAAGIPTVLYGAGPRSMLEANAHRADERVKLTDVYMATEVIAGALVDLLAP
jgi:acetylornithine deacetylase/succinyl-diaminopimelate desuccinylase family protein